MLCGIDDTYGQGRAREFIDKTEIKVRSTPLMVASLFAELLRMRWMRRI